MDRMKGVGYWFVATAGLTLLTLVGWAALLSLLVLVIGYFTKGSLYLSAVTLVGTLVMGARFAFIIVCAGLALMLIQELRKRLRSI